MPTRFNRLRRAARQTGLVVLYAAFFATLALMLQQEYRPPGDLETRVGLIVGAEHFDFMQWTLGAWLEKGAQLAVPVQDYLNADQQRQFVLDFMSLTRKYWDLEEQVRRIYIDAAQTDPAGASAELRAQRDAVRAEVERRRPTAEAILQQQVAAVLDDEGFGVGGEVLPPVAARITPLPYVLIVSPRDDIRRVTSDGLQTGLSVDQAETIEARVLSETNHSALVVPIGGLADYPSMILETTDLLFLVQTISHEWSHHWLYFRPLGLAYVDPNTPDARTINETVASIFGDEIGLKVMRRFYLDELKRTHPDQVEPRPPALPVPPSPQTSPAPEPGAFSFSRAMHETRVEVDRLLAQARDLEAQGKQSEAEERIKAAEAYMEQRRQYINSQGYGIRKLNQAYFAFYGAYADQPGASGSDPVGPNVVALRYYSPTIRDFLERASSILTVDALQRAVAAFKSAP